MNRLETISNVDNLKKAWEALKRNKNSYGIDDVTIADFKSNLDANLVNISIKLRNNTYKFSPVRGVAIPKPGSVKKRPIRVATVSDRVVQKAIEHSIAGDLTKIFNIKNDASYAYIKNKGLLKAVAHINKLIKDGYDICLRGDIKNYFDEVNTEHLLNDMVFPALGRDKSLNNLIEKSLTQEVGNIKSLRKRLGSKQAGQLFPNIPTGIPQGGILSPLFSNIYLKELDDTLINNGFKLVRYADDFIVLCKDLDEALAAYNMAQKIIDSLGLKLHPLTEKSITKSNKKKQKTYLSTSNDFEFLGIAFKYGELYPCLDAFKKMKARLKELTRKNALKPRSLGNKLYRVEDLIEGWARTYWFTSNDKRVKQQYELLNDQLINTVKEIISSNGLSFISGSLSDSKKLKRIGLPKFQHKTASVKDKYLQDKRKVELVKIFNPHHKVE